MYNKEKETLLQLKLLYKAYVFTNLVFFSLKLFLGEAIIFGLEL